MYPITNIMSEIARLQIENAELRKGTLVRELPAAPIAATADVMKAEPPHYHPRAIMSDQKNQAESTTEPEPRSEVMFSDEKGFEQFAGPDYGMNTRAEKAGFMSVGDEKSEDHEKALKNRHKFNGYPIHVAQKFFE